MSTTIRVFPVQGEKAQEFIPDLARLRIQVFREFPYLYDGDMAYEQRYLQTYIQSPRSVIVIATDGDRVVGASTAIPMADETDSFQQAFIKAGYDVDKIFYFGESVLLQEYRGQGIGVRFFEERELHAKRVGEFELYTFCAVERPLDHPLRPADYQDLSEFWNHRGFQKKPELYTHYKWKDLNESLETEKKMVYWMKPVKAGMHES